MGNQVSHSESGIDMKSIFQKEESQETKNYRKIFSALLSENNLHELKYGITCTMEQKNEKLASRIKKKSRNQYKYNVKDLCFGNREQDAYDSAYMYTSTEKLYRLLASF